MKILIVDDHVLFRDGLVSMLRGQADIEIVGEAGLLSEAIEMARELRPEVVLMDFTLPDGDGTQATRAILDENPGAIIVFLTMHDANDRLFAAIRSGAKGYLLKNMPFPRLLESLRGLAKNEAAISREMTARILEEFSRLGPPQEPERSKLASLTLREVEILRELATEASNHEIAGRLTLTETTVKNHVHSILKKLELRSRQEAARFARQQGLGKF
jgi:DNA-binding NarL/FixJ family response regulator